MSTELVITADESTLVISTPIPVSSGDAPNYGRVITVAQSGGDHSTIADAITAASALTPSASNPVLIRIAPGTYTESDLTVPSYVTITGMEHARAAVIVDGTGGTATFNMNAEASVRSLTIQNGGYALRGVQAGYQRVSDVRALNTSGYLWDTSLAIMLGEIVRAEKTSGGVGGVGFEASGGGIITGRLLNVQGSAGNQFTDGFLASGAGSSIQSVGMIATYCVDSFEANTGGYLSATNAAAANITTAGLHTNNATVSFNSYGISSGSQTYDIWAENAADSIDTFYGEYDQAKVELAAGASLVGAAFSSNPNEQALRVLGELHVGSEDNPSETALGGGDSHTRGMKVLTNTNGEAGTWADITSSLLLNDGTSVPMFSSNTADAALYVGGNYAFPGVKIVVSTALVVSGGGVVAEYWNGSSWTSFDVMLCDADSPYLSYGNVALIRANSEQVRFGPRDSWATKTLNGETKYWARYRITSPVGTLPEADQIKIHTDRFEANRDGFTEWFGAAEPEKDLPVHLRLSDVLTGFAPGDATLNISTNIQLELVGNEFSGSGPGRKDGFGGILEIPAGLDTSRPLRFVVAWTPSSNGAGDVELEFAHAVLNVGDVLDGSIADVAAQEIVSVSGQQGELILTEFQFTIPSAVPGSLLAYTLFRDATAANADDTYTGNVNVAFLRLAGDFWR